MQDRVTKTSDRSAEANVLSDAAEQKRQQHRLREAMEDDEVFEALKCLHHGPAAGAPRARPPEIDRILAAD